LKERGRTQKGQRVSATQFARRRHRAETGQSFRSGPKKTPREKTKRSRFRLDLIPAGARKRSKLTQKEKHDRAVVIAVSPNLIVKEERQR